jgi:hypothetical protein
MANLKNAKRVSIASKQKTAEQQVVGMLPRILETINKRPWIPIVILLALAEIFFAGIYFNLKTLFYYVGKI